MVSMPAAVRDTSAGAARSGGKASTAVMVTDVPRPTAPAQMAMASGA